MADTAFSKRQKSFIVSDMDGTREFPARTMSKRQHSPALKIFVRVFVAGAAMFFGGFLLFCNMLLSEAPGSINRADGIVALTGGEARIPVAVKLLAKRHGRRLLISGVNPSTRLDELASLTPNSKNWFNCCIDLGREAQNTIGNAEEAREWAQRRQFHSLIVVTASYHMPRSMAELRRALPDTVLVPYPVKPRNLHVHSWWAYPGTLQLLMVEYVKFIPALGRCSLSQVSHGYGVIGGTRRCINGGYAG